MRLQHPKGTDWSVSGLCVPSRETPKCTRGPGMNPKGEMLGSCHTCHGLPPPPSKHTLSAESLPWCLHLLNGPDSLQGPKEADMGMSLSLLQLPRTHGVCLCYVTTGWSGSQQVLQSATSFMDSWPGVQAVLLSRV